MSSAAVALIVVPYELGRCRQGVGCGPEHILAHGAESALASNGASVRIQHIELEPQFNETGSGEADAAFEIIRHVARAVRAARDAGEFPIVLAGSCFSAVGVVAGLNEPETGVVWFDAHPDFCEPATTISGYFDSMGLAVLTGSAWQGLHATVPDARPVPETCVILAGARSFDDPSETARLKASKIRRLSCEQLRAPDRLVDTIRQATPPITGLYVHIDLDVLDDAIARANIFSVPDGLHDSQLDALLGALLTAFPVRAITLSAYDPAFDKEGRMPPIARRLLHTIASAL